MKKLTNAQIREQVRKDLTKSFEKKYESEIKSLENFKQLYHKTLEEKAKIARDYSEINTKYEELKDKVAQYEDWITRLQEFMDIEDVNERKSAFETYIKKQKTESELNDMLNVYCGMFNRIFSF